MVFQESFLEAAQKKAAEKRATPKYQEDLPRRQFEQILKILGQNEFNISRNPVKDLGEQIVIGKNNEQYQIFILKNECFSGESLGEFCQMRKNLEELKAHHSMLKETYGIRRLGLGMILYSNGSDEKKRRARQEKQEQSINEIEQNISEKQEKLIKLGGNLEKKPLRDVMPKFGTWVGGVAPELVEFIGAHLEMSEGHKLSKRVQKVAFSK